MVSDGGRAAGHRRKDQSIQIEKGKYFALIFS
jgi:hypothetical protein